MQPQTNATASTSLFPAKKQFKTILFSAAALFATISTGYSEVIYQQVFNNTTGSWARPSTLGIDWKTWVTIGNYDGFWAGLGVSPSASLSTTGSNIGAATPTEQASSANGLFVLQSGSVSMWTNSIPLNIADHSSIKFDWLQENGFWGGSNAEATIRVLIQISGVWYVSAQSSAFHRDTQVHAESYLFDPTASNWLVLSSSANPHNANYATLSTHAAADLSGTITAVGLSLYSPGGYHTKVDNFTVSVTPIPEPSTTSFVLGLCAVGAMAGWSYKKRQSRTSR